MKGFLKTACRGAAALFARRFGSCSVLVRVLQFNRYVKEVAEKPHPVAKVSPGCRLQGVLVEQVADGTQSDTWVMSATVL